MALRDMPQSRVRALLDRVVPIELTRKNRELVERRHRRQNPIDRRCRQAGGRLAIDHGQEGQPDARQGPPMRDRAQILQQLQGVGRAKLVPGQRTSVEETPEMLQVVGISDEGIRRAVPRR
jgi:hypothetical protein